MKTYKNLYDNILTKDIIGESIENAAKFKYSRNDVKYVINNLDIHYNKLLKYFNNENWQPYFGQVYDIHDGKPRKIEKPRFFPEHVMEHILINPFKNILFNGLYEQVYGGLPLRFICRKDNSKVVRTHNFGLHKAIKQLKTWVQVPKKIYVCEADVHHAYMTVNIHILVQQLKRIIKDDKYLNMVCKFLRYDSNDSEQCGLPLGHYISPWFFNFYLKEFDHFVASHSDVKYLRYADNIFLVSSNKRKLRQALEDIDKYLNEKLKLTLNTNSQIYRFEYKDKKGNVRGRAINALGAVIHYNRVGLRKSILRSIRRKALKMLKKVHNQKRITSYDATSMMSRLSWVDKTDIYNYYMKHIRINIDVKQMLGKIRRYSRNIGNLQAKETEKLKDILHKWMWEA